MEVDEVVHAPNALLLIATSRSPDTPFFTDPTSLIHTGADCVLVAVQHEAEGSLHVTLSDESGPPGQEGLTSGWSGVLPCVEGFVAVESVMGERWLSLSWRGERVHVEVWVSELQQAERIWVSLRRP